MLTPEGQLVQSKEESLKELQSLEILYQTKPNMIMDERFMNNISYIIALLPSGELARKMNNLFSCNLIGEPYNATLHNEVLQLIDNLNQM